jgi:uncharacterized protein YjiS (DUF1127 family)
MTDMTAALSRPLVPGLRAGPLAMLARMAETRRQRRALARLDARALDDIGVSPAEARAEAARPAWDAPARWRA